MKITLSKLKQLIKEELQNTILNENQKIAADVRGASDKLLTDLENQDLMQRGDRDHTIARIERLAKSLNQYAYELSPGQERAILIANPEANERGIVGIVPFLLKKANDMKKANVSDEEFASHADGIAINVRKKLSNLSALSESKKDLSKKEKAYLLVDPSDLNEKGKKKKDHVDHK